MDLTLAWNDIMTKLLLVNAQRSGALQNVIVGEFRNARLVDGHYIMDVLS